MNFRHTIIFLLFVMIIFSSCSRVAVSTEKLDTPKTKLDRVLIIALSNVYDTRAMYEKELSYRLRQLGYNMFSSVNVDKSKRELFTRDEVIKLIEDKNIDGIITMKLKSVTSKERYGTSDRYISDMNNWQTYFFNYVDTYTNVYSWSYIPEQTVTVIAELHEAASKKVLYRIEVTSKNADGPEERAGEITEAVAKAFHRSGFLKKKNE